MQVAEYEWIEMQSDYIIVININNKVVEHGSV
jgi:hypothetical protein